MYYEASYLKIDFFEAKFIPIHSTNLLKSGHIRKKWGKIIFKLKQYSNYMYFKLYMGY